jgi:hypothetical protein
LLSFIRDEREEKGKDLAESASSKLFHQAAVTATQVRGGGLMGGGVMV